MRTKQQQQLLGLYRIAVLVDSLFPGTRMLNPSFLLLLIVPPPPPPSHHVSLYIHSPPTHPPTSSAYKSVNKDCWLESVA